jgi:hypothetical protein
LKLQGVRRACEALLKSYLANFPCVAIVGIRQCGKTTLLGSLPKGWKQLDLERRADREVVARDPDGFFRLNPARIALDEAQQTPEVFPALRVAIDERRSEKGRFVITGSSSPELLREVSETLAGRVGIIELAPFSWAEVTKTTGRDSLVARLLDRKAKPAELIDGLRARADVVQAHDFWFRGGFPEPWLARDSVFRQRWTEQYLQTYLYRCHSRPRATISTSRTALFCGAASLPSRGTRKSAWSGTRAAFCVTAAFCTRSCAFPTATRS